MASHRGVQEPKYPGQQQSSEELPEQTASPSGEAGMAGKDEMLDRLGMCEKSSETSLRAWEVMSPKC